MTCFPNARSGGLPSICQPFLHSFLFIDGDRHLDLPVVLLVEAEDVLVVAAINRLIVLIEIVPTDPDLGNAIRPETLGPDLGPCMSDAILPVETGALVEQALEGTRLSKDRGGIIGQESAGNAIMECHKLGVVTLQRMGVSFEELVDQLKRTIAHKTCYLEAGAQR